MRDICVATYLRLKTKWTVYLGVSFSTNLNDMLDLNYQNAYGAIQNILINTWSKGSLSVPGRITIVKSLLLSKLYYFSQLLPNPSEVFMSNLNMLNNIVFKFVWSGDEIKRSQIILDYKFSGAKLPHIQTQFNALKVGWLRRIIFGDKNGLDCFKQRLR